MAVIARTLSRLRQHLDLDIAYIAELDGDDMIIRAHCAPALQGKLPEQMVLPRKTAICHYMASGEIANIVKDVSREPKVANLQTTKDFHIGSYIGIPLERTDGSLYGTICCVGHNPNTTLNARDLRSIKLFGEIVAEQIDLELEDRRQTNDRESRIRSVIDNRSFEVVFQPVIALNTSNLKGFEALCRFDGVPYRSPDKWFADAGASQLGLELELTVIEAALANLKDLPPDASLSLNASPECIMPEHLSDLLLTHDSERLVLELTEHAEVADYGELSRYLARYKQQGIKIAVDDAGAGYSSLSHIVQIHPDIIKLDMSLTRDIDSDQVRRSLASALIHFAGEIGAAITAEGIETQLEMETLHELGASYGQGYFFSKPLPLEDARVFDVSEAPLSASTQAG